MKTRFFSFALFAAGTAAAQQPVTTQHGIVAIHNLRIEDTTYVGQVPGIWAIDGADTMFGFLPMYMLPDTTLLVGGDTVYTSGNFTGGGGGGGLDSVNLAADVYGVLPVPNGGTGHDTLTANKVLVGNGTSPILSPAALHWDNVNSRLGIGTSTPNEQLELTGNLRLPSTTTTVGVIYLGTSRFLHGRTSNTFVGGVAGNMTLTGSVNTAVGNSAMPAITSGLFNSGLGGSVLLSLTSGSRNAALGHQAARSLTTGEYNTAVGGNAMYNITTTSYNTAIGYDAGRVLANGTSSNTTGSRSVFIGASTKAKADNERNQIVIGYNTTGLGANTVIIGNDSITTTALRGNVGIGTTTPARRLHIAGEVRITDLLTDTATVIVGADADGDLDRIVVGSGLTLANDTLSATGGGGGSGTVTSVGLTMPGGFSVANSPVTTSGTLAGTTTLNGPLRGNGSAFTTGNTNMASEVTGVLPVANGGTGQSTLTANKVLVGNGTTGVLQPSALHWDNSNTRLGINSTSPGGRLHVSDGNTPAAALVTTDDYLQSAQNYATGASWLVASNNSVHRGVLKGTRARGTLASPTFPSTGDDVLSLLGAIYDGTTTQGTAEVLLETDGATSSGIAPQRISFITSTTNAASRTQRLRIAANGNIAIGNITPSYILDISSTNAMRIPLGLDATRPSAADGLLRYSTTSGTLEWSDASNWYKGVNGEGQSPASGFNRVALWTGASGQTSDEDFSFNISTGQLKMLKYSSATAFTGTSVAQLHVTSTGLVITKTPVDTQYVSLVAVNPGTTVTQTAGTAFHQGSFLVPEHLDGYVIRRTDYALTNCNSTTGTLSVGFRHHNTTNGTIASNNLAVSFAGASSEVRKSSTATLTVNKNQWLRAEVNPSTSGTLNNTVEGLLIVLMLTK